MRVLKFGGSSVASPERIRLVGDILTSYLSEGIHYTVVFSAFGGVTDLLLRLASLAEDGDDSYKTLAHDLRSRHLDAVEALLPADYPGLAETKAHLDDSFNTLEDIALGVYLVREASLRTIDYILSFGERSSSYIISHYLRSMGIDAGFLDAREVVSTNKHFGNASVHKDLTYSNIRSFYEQQGDTVFCVTGFIGSAKGGLTTTLGRGGSDYTAALLGAALDAEIIEIWTDVDGILTCDPRIVPQAFTIPKVSYNEAYEMSHFGAKVIYPPTIRPAHERNIPLRIKNTFNPSHPGTLVSRETMDYDKPVKGVSSISNVCLLTLQGSGLIGVPGVAARLFASLATANINIIMITQGSSEHSITFAILPSSVSKAKKVVENEFQKEIHTNKIEPLIVEEDLSVLAIIGENMRYVPGIAAKMMWALGSNGINASAIAQGSSELNISVVVSSTQKQKALLALHEAFFLSEYRVIHLFMVGVGLIGKTLLDQLAYQTDYLRNQKKIIIKLCGLANSKKMCLTTDGVDPSLAVDSLKDSEKKMSIDEFTDEILSLNLNNSVFVDNTADTIIPQYYQKLLSNGISVCTPNKIAASSSLANYLELNHLALRNNLSFGYETNVGAGLPIISSINDLINSGDTILRLEAVLSGSLSYIFNSYHLSDKSFASIVREAMTLGYTEPDPRTDLSGVDVKRKIIILARETGSLIEASEVQMTSFLPEECQKLLLEGSIDDFLFCLESHEPHFSALRTYAHNNNRKAVFIAKLDEGRASIELKNVDAHSPFYNLSGSDNMLSISSHRYNVTPLVIQGPGAGAEVTAAGLFAEIISLANKNLSI